MSTLSYIEKKVVDDLFNSGGYVLNFSTAEFDMFCIDLIGIALCEEYGLSKGKSLFAYISKGDDKDVGILIRGLLNYYEKFYSDDLKNEDTKNRFEECKRIAERLNNCIHSKVIDEQSKDIVESFGTEYIAKQIEMMNTSIIKNPTEAIGKAKELLESCSKTILENLEVEYDKSWDMQRLMKETCKNLKLTPEDIPEEVNAAKTIKKILGSLAAITNGMAELRNPYGSGHGKAATYKGLTNRHAGLAVGSAVTAVKFLWDTYEKQKGV